MRYTTRAAIAIDTCINALLPKGRLDETLSTHAMIRSKNWPWSWLYFCLDHCFPKHCELAREHDIKRALNFVKYGEKTEE